MRENFDEARQHLLPVIENIVCGLTSRELKMFLDQIPYQLDIARFDHWFKINRRQIASLLGEIASLVADVSNAAAHSSCKISTARTQHDHQAISHVLTTVVADALHHRSCSGIA